MFICKAVDIQNISKCSAVANELLFPSQYYQTVTIETRKVSQVVLMISSLSIFCCVVTVFSWGPALNFAKTGQLVNLLVVLDKKTTPNFEQ